MTEAILQNFDDRSVPKKKNPGRSPDMVIEQRRQRLYKRQLEGLPARHLVLEHSSREGVLCENCMERLERSFKVE